MIKGHTTKVLWNDRDNCGWVTADETYSAQGNAEGARFNGTRISGHILPRDSGWRNKARHVLLCFLGAATDTERNERKGQRDKFKKKMK